ncbi:MAG: tail fiber domain-containing protein [Parcubacteria group bacterium]
MDITPAQTTFSNPVNFAGTGDVSMAYDLYLTNTTAGYLKFNGPGYIQTESPSDNLDLTLSAANSGYVVIADTLQMAGDILPDADDTYNLGSDTARFANLWLGADTLHIGTSSADEAWMSYDTTNDRFNLGVGATGSAPALTILSGGNVGIGTTNPVYELDVVGRVNASNYVRAGYFAGVGNFAAYTASVAANDYRFYTRNAGDTGWNQPFSILGSSTSVGIGGTAAATAPTLFAAGTGSVGIGTTAPGTTLDVTGTGRFSSTLTASSGFTLTAGTLSLPASSVTDAMVSDTLTASNLVAASSVVSNAEVDDNLTITGGSIDSTTTIDKDPVITLGTDLTGNVTLSNLASGTLNATIAANSVALTTDTTGNYVAGLTAGTAITITGTAGEAWSPTVAVTADSIGDTQLAFDTGQALTTASSPTFAGLTLSANLVLGANTLTTTNETVITHLNADLLDGQHGAYYATAASISGTDNYIPRFNGTSALENSIIYDDGTNVGIGTTSPIGTIHTVGSATGSTWLSLFAQNGINPQNSSVISAAQNKAVAVQGDGAAYFLGRDVTNNIEFIMGTSSAGTAFAGAMTAHDFQLRTNNVTRVTVAKDTGNTIFTGTGAFGTNAFINGSGISYFNGGSVGIGTTAPGTTLDVTGTGRFSSTLTASNGFTLTAGTLSLPASSVTDAMVSDTLTASNLVAASSVVSNAEVDDNLTITGGSIDSTTTIDKDPVITLGTDLTGNVTLSNLASGTLNATIAANSVALTTDTTGNYVAGLTAGTAITITGTAGEAWSPTVAVTADSIGDTQLAFNTGQHLTTTSSPTFAGLTLTNALTVPNGGTGASTLTGVLKGNGTSAFTAMTGTANYAARWTDANTLGIGTLFDDGTNVGIGTSVPSQLFQVNNSGSTAFVVTSGGNVGIGTTSPGNKLTISGGVGIGTTAPGSSYLSTAAPDGGLIVESYVGIGTTSPEQLLHISGASGLGGATPVTNYLYSTTAGTWTDDSIFSQLTFGNGDGSGGTAGVKAKIAAYIDDATGASTGLSFYSSLAGASSLTERMRIDGSGNVGIGTIAPTVKLDVNIADNTTVAAGWPGTFQIQSTDALMLENKQTDGLAEMTTLFFRNYNSVDSITNVAGRIGLLRRSSGVGDFAFMLRNESLYNEVMRLTGTGSVGIGTTSPGTTLDVTGTGRFSSTLTASSGFTVTAGTITLPSASLSKTVLANSGTLGFTWSDAEVSDTLTASNLVAASSVVSNAEVDDNLTITGGSIDSTTTIDKDPVITLGTDLTGNVTLSNLASGTLNATIAANSVALSTDTTGNYVAGLTAGTAITITGTAGEAWSPTVAVTADAIGDTQLAFNTGQHLTTTSSPTFAGLTLTNALTVPNGGTGASTLTGVLKGNGTSAFTAMTGTANYAARWTDANTLGIGTLFDDGTNVGIGTTAPQSKLDITTTTANTASVISAVANIGGASTAIGQLSFIGTNYDANGQTLAYVQGVTNVLGRRYGDLAFGTGLDSAAEKMRIDYLGNVGIGTTAPGEKLEIGDGNILLTSTAASDKNITLKNIGNTTQGSLVFKKNSGDLVSAKISTFGTAAYNVKGLAFYTGNYADFTTSLSDADIRMLISSAGNVGIGTTLPYQLFQINNSGSTAFVVTSGGNVGIGTTSPQTALDIVGNAKISLRSYIPGATGTSGQGYFTGTSTTPLGTFQSMDLSGKTYTFFATNKFYNGTAWVDMGQSRVGSSFEMYDDAFAFFSFDTAASYTRRFTIDSGGNVGIGPDSTPDYLLDVQGTLHADGNTTIDGNVGIGTTSPNSKLHIAGGAAQIGMSASAITYATRENSLIFNRADVPTSWFNKITNSISATGVNATMNFEIATGASTSINALTLNGSGYAGFGPTSPAAKVHVQIADNTTITSGWPGTFAPQATDALLLENNQTSGTAEMTSILFRNYNSGDGTVYQTGRIGLLRSGSGTGDFAFSLRHGGDYNEIMRISGFGGVGIGTTSPGNKLSVSGGVGIGTTNPASIYLSTAAPDGGLITEGNVGIGTLDPNERLEIGGGNLRVWNDSELGDEVVTSWTNHATSPFEIFTPGSGTDITQASNTSVGGVCYSNSFSGAAGRLYKATFTMTNNATTLPYFRVATNVALSVYILNKMTVAGTNTIYFYIPTDATFYVGFYTTNTAANDFAVSGFSVKPVAGGNVIASGQFTGGGVSGIKVDLAGNIGIGTTSPDEILDIRHGSRPVVQLYNTDPIINANQLIGGLYFGGADDADTNTGAKIEAFSENSWSTSASTALTFWTSALGDTTLTPIERMRITNGGNVGIGTTAPTNLLDVAGGVKIGAGYAGIGTTAPQNGMLVEGSVGIGTSTPGYALQIGTAGDGTEARANAWNSLSDARLKTNLATVSDPLEKIQSLTGYYYDWKSGIDHSKQFGLLAQDVESVLPEIVSTDSQGYKSLDYGKLTPLLVEGIKQQQGEISQSLALGEANSRTLGDINLQITNQSSDINDLQTAVNDKLNIVSNSFTALDSRTAVSESQLSTLSSQLSIAQTKLAESENNLATFEASTTDLLTSMMETENMITAKLLNHEDRIKALEDKLATATITVGEIPANVITQDASGNATLAGIFKAKEVNADSIETKTATVTNLDAQQSNSDESVSGLYSVKTDDIEASSLGEAEIAAVSRNENVSVVAEGTGSDGKSVFVPTKAVTDSSEVFVTSKTMLDQPLVVTEVKPGEGFKVAIKNPADENIKFSWWIVNKK